MASKLAHLLFDDPPPSRPIAFAWVMISRPARYRSCPSCLSPRLSSSKESRGLHSTSHQRVCRKLARAIGHTAIRHFSEASASVARATAGTDELIVARKNRPAHVERDEHCFRSVTFPCMSFRAPFFLPPFLAKQATRVGGDKSAQLCGFIALELLLSTYPTGNLMLLATQRSHCCYVYVF